MPDTDLARVLGTTQDAVRLQRWRLGVPCYTRPARACRVCDQPANCRPGFCHVHRERWRRWGKPDPAEWAAAFLEERLSTCAVCGKRWNGYFGCRHCSPECLAAWKRKAALEHWNARTPESKDAAHKRQKELKKRRTREKFVLVRCVGCGVDFLGSPHRKTCGRPGCTSKNVTQGSRAFRSRRAANEIVQAAAALERKMKDAENRD